MRQAAAIVNPKRIARTDGGFSILWDDGHEGSYSYELLRSRCPCATCLDRPPTVVSADDPLKLYDQEPIYADDASLVGRYGIRFHWNDGHSAGIFSFEYLRRLCPCQSCRPPADGNSGREEVE